MNEDLQKIFEGMELNEEIKAKFESLFEARIQEETAQIKEQAETEAEEKYSALAEEYAQYVVTELEEKADQYVAEELVPKVEQYLDHVAESFLSENKLVVESQLKVELADKFLASFGQLTEAYNVELPAGQDDLVADLENKLKEANEQVDALVTQSAKLKEQIEQHQKSTIVESVTSDMTETTKERFVESASKVKFIDAEQFKAAVVELAESFAPGKQEELKEEKEIETKEMIKESSSYLDSLFVKL